MGKERSLSILDEWVGTVAKAGRPITKRDRLALRMSKDRWSQVSFLVRRLKEKIAATRQEWYAEIRSDAKSDARAREGQKEDKVMNEVDKRKKETRIADLRK